MQRPGKWAALQMVSVQTLICHLLPRLESLTFPCRPQFLLLEVETNPDCHLDVLSFHKVVMGADRG